MFLHLCDLFCYFVQHHSFRIKYFFLGNSVVMKALLLLYSHEKHLVLAALRFFRGFVGMKDEFYNRYIVKNQLMEHVLEAFRRNGSRNNLLNSAILELFDFIRKENMKTLIHHVVENYFPWVADVDYVDTFKQLRLKYEQNQEVAKTTGYEPTDTSSPQAKVPNDGRGLDPFEESYFDASDDDEDANAGHRAARNVAEVVPDLEPAMPEMRRGLVDYDSDVDERGFYNTANANNSDTRELAEFPATKRRRL